MRPEIASASTATTMPISAPWDNFAVGADVLLEGAADVVGPEEKLEAEVDVPDGEPASVILK